MKNRKQAFLRAILITSIISFLLIMGFLMTVKAYENTRFVLYGEYKKAIEVSNGVLRVFDYEIVIN